MKKIFSSLCLLGISCSLMAHSEKSSTTIEAIVLEPTDSLKGFSPHASGVLIGNLKVPQGANALAERLQPFLGKSLSKETLLQVKSEILAYYAENHHPYLVVEIPEQEVTSGKVRYTIIEGEIGEISYKGNRWVSSRNLERYLHLKPGDPIDERLLLNDIASMNRNPFHSSEVVLEKGKKNGLTNIEITTQDRFPLRVFGGVDNTGNPFTGNTRNYIGFNWGNAFFIDDLLTYQFTMANNYHRFWSHFANYTSYLSWGHTLFLYGGYSEIHPHIPNFKSEGKSYQGSLRYNIPFKPYYTSITHELGIGFDIKGMNSSLFFSDLTGDIPVSAHLANLSQAVLSYELRLKSKNHKFSLDLEVVGSPVAWMANQNKKRFNEIRPHANPLYAYGRLFAADVWTLPKQFALATTVRMQGAGTPLMPSEQMGLGGYNTVRGYDEHAFNADTALCANLEIRMPPLKVFKKGQTLTFLGFADYGLGHNFKNDFNEVPSTEYLFGAGPGVRYEIFPYLSLRVDYGFKFHKFVNSGPGMGKLHFSATASY